MQVHQFPGEFPWAPQLRHIRSKATTVTVTGGKPSRRASCHIARANAVVIISSTRLTSTCFGPGATDCHRFSIEWSRIEPVRGRWSDDALEHYRRVILALKCRQIEPVVTLHHFSNPAWFSRRGGWLRRDAAALFARFVARIAEFFSTEVRLWITINEPTVYVMQGHVNGVWPPFECGKLLNATRALVSLAAAHRKAYSIIKSRQPQAMVGFAHNALLVEPCDAERARDRVAARTRGDSQPLLFPPDWRSLRFHRAQLLTRDVASGRKERV